MDKTHVIRIAEAVSLNFANRSDESTLIEFAEAIAAEEREQCAAIADARAMRCEAKTATAEDEDEVAELRSLAWQFSVLAAEMRKRSNA